MSGLDVGGVGGGGGIGGACEPHACGCGGVGDQYACAAAVPEWYVGGSGAWLLVTMPAWYGVPGATACEPEIWKEALASCSA